MTSNEKDRGVVLVLGVPPSTVKNREGTTITPTVIDNTVWQASADIYVGAGQDLVLWLQGLIAGAGTALVRFEDKRGDNENTTLWQWASEQTERGDSGVVLAEHTIAASELVGVADNTARQAITLRTSSHRRSGKARLIVKWSQAKDAADWMVAAVDYR